MRFTATLFPDLRADFILANPPFNKDDWFSEALHDDPRWIYGLPPASNANFAWVQHFLYHLAPNGTAGFVLANGSLSTKTSGEGEIRRKLVEADHVDCIVAMPGNLFYNTGIPVSLWFVAKNRANHLSPGPARHRTVHRRPQARPHGDSNRSGPRRHRRRPHRQHVPRLARHRTDRDYEDIPGFCKAATFEEIAHARLRT